MEGIILPYKEISEIKREKEKEGESQLSERKEKPFREKRRKERVLSQKEERSERPR